MPYHVCELDAFRTERASLSPCHLPSGMAPINNSWKLPGTIDLVCRVFVPRDSLRLLSELWSLTEASLSATVIAMVRERG